MIKLKKEQQQKIMLGVILYMVMLVMFNNLVFKKLSTNLKANRESLKILKAEEEIAVLKAGALTKKEQELKDAYKKSDIILNKFIKNSDKKYLIEGITESGKKNRVIFKTAAFKEESREKYKEFIIDQKVTADYRGILNFFYSFDTMNKKIKINSCNLKKSGSKIEADIQLSTYMLNEVIKSGE